MDCFSVVDEDVHFKNKFNLAIAVKETLKVKGKLFSILL